MAVLKSSQKKFARKLRKFCAKKYGHFVKTLFILFSRKFSKNFAKKFAKYERKCSQNSAVFRESFPSLETLVLDRKYINTNRDYYIIYKDALNSIQIQFQQVLVLQNPKRYIFIKTKTKTTFTLVLTVKIENQMNLHREPVEQIDDF